MSSPTSTPRRTPKRTTPKRTPLQERTPSQKNEDAGRLHRDSKQELTDTQIFSSNPFPTKPQHVLLPSTVRQRSRQNAESELPVLFGSSQPDLSSSTSVSQRRQDERRIRRAPNLNLKKSVTALRDMYEAQAESSRPSTAHYSRPSTAAQSPAQRPTTASSRLRSISSSEGLSGRGAWEMLGLPKVSPDDLSTLPTLSEAVARRFDSDQSFASRMRNNPATSSPNFRTFGSSSPGLPTYHDVATTSDVVEESSSSGVEMTGLSSGFIQLHLGSSEMTTDPTPPLHEEDEEEDQGESSPNLVKLGTSSPMRLSSPARSVASTGSRKRKRSEMEGSAYAGRTPLSFGAQRERRHSSPPIRNIPANSDMSVQSSETRVLPSSPPEAESAKSQHAASSPNIQVYGVFSADRSSIVSAHANLQTVLSSSPGPPVVRPIVKAPDVHQFENLALQKRTTSGQTADSARLSPVPSVTNIEVQQLSSTDLSQFQQRRSSSRISVFTEDLNEDNESIAPAHAYIMEHDLNSSQVDMISDHDRHEAADELRALPRQHNSFAAALSQVRSASYFGSTSSSTSNSRYDSMRTSMDSRLQSMRSFVHTRNNSFMSSARPGSSSSYVSQNFAVPTWARQYYSGLYRHSFHYLYQSSSNLPYTVTQVQPLSQTSSRPGSMPISSHGTSSSRSLSKSRISISRSVRSSIKNIIPSLPIRPRLNVRQSHTTVGIGPLVSHPVRPQSELLTRPPTAYQDLRSIRRVSAPLSAADPRYHWNGIIEEPETAEEAESMQDLGYTGTPRYVDSATTPSTYQGSNIRHPLPFRFLRVSTPHLHQDRRLHTGSSASQGFGAPYNARPRWQPPSGQIDEVKTSHPIWSPDLRDAQVICFIIGFICPLAWFIGAMLPLPQRPSRYSDIEKSSHNSRNYTDATNWDEGDILARLRLEKHLKGLEEVKWQNSRWWRRMNRWMSVVGFVVVIIVIVLAVIGIRGQLS